MLISVMFVVFTMQVIKNEDKNKEKFQDVGTNKTFHIYENSSENNDLQGR